MEININNEKKIISIWCSKSENADASLKAYTNIEQYKNYTVAIFRSGNQELYNGTYKLLRHNYNME